MPGIIVGLVWAAPWLTNQLHSEHHNHQDADTNPNVQVHTPPIPRLLRQRKLCRILLHQSLLPQSF